MKRQSVLNEAYMLKTTIDIDRYRYLTSNNSYIRIFSCVFNNRISFLY